MNGREKNERAKNGRTMNGGKKEDGNCEAPGSFSIFGRGAYPGEAEGEAVVCPDSIAGNSGALGDTDGIIYETGNRNYGVCIKGKILVVPCAKGSNGFSAHFKGAQIAGVSPAGWISVSMDARLGAAIASMGIPAVTDFPEEQNPLKLIQTGDWVKVNGRTGEVQVRRKGAGIVCSEAERGTAKISLTPEERDCQQQARELMRGAYDLHTHPEPSAFSRALNDWELVHEADALGMAGVMIKAHYGCTAARAAMINQISGCGTKAYGGLVLNWPVGGLNPYAVENSLKMGAVIIWMPTRDAGHCLSYGDMPGDFFRRPGISVLDEAGKLVPEVYAIMNAVKEYGAYLATGHLSMEESILLCRAGREQKVNMILTHPEWSRTRIPGEVQRELASLGVVIEKNWVNLAEKTVTAEEMAANIRMAGPEHVYLATDRGQKGAEHPAQGMQFFIETLLKQGFSEQEITTMVRTVPSCIAGRQPLF